MTEQESFELKCINTIRTLSIDAVQAANSGHPGTPMAMALLPHPSRDLWRKSRADLSRRAAAVPKSAAAGEAGSRVYRQYR